MQSSSRALYVLLILGNALIPYPRDCSPFALTSHTLPFENKRPLHF